MWDDCRVQGELHKGVVIGMHAEVSLHNNRPQITARRIRILDDDPSAYLIAAPVPRETLLSELKQMVDSVSDLHLSIFAQTNPPRNLSLYSAAPRLPNAFITIIWAAYWNTPCRWPGCESKQPKCIRSSTGMCWLLVRFFMTSGK